MKRVITIILTVILILSMLTACGETKQPATETVNNPSESSAPSFANEEYVFITAASSIEYFNAHKKGLQDACAALGVKATIVGDDKVDAGTMSNLIDATIERGVAGMVIVGHFPDAYAPLVEKAFKKGIPVVAQTIDIEGAITFIGVDFYSYGKRQMDLMAEAIGEKGKIAISTSMDSGPAAVDSLNGMKDRCAEKYPNIEIVAVLEDKCQLDTAVNVIGACIQANPDLSGILGSQSISGIAAVTACREAGKSGKIKIVAVDRDVPTLEAIEAGDIYGTVCGKQYAEVYYATKLLFDFNHTKLLLSNNDEAAGIIGVPSYVDLGAMAITKDNVEYFLGFEYKYDK